MDFNKEVIERSQFIPVLVDFWAPWCGPCKYIGPILEDLAEEEKGKWELVKINVDKNEELSYKYQIRGIPAIKLFSRGEVIGEFGGAMPKHKVLKWLEEHLPDKNKEFLNNLLSENRALGDQILIDQLESFIKDNPGNSTARVELAKNLLVLDAGRSFELVQDIKIGSEEYEKVEHIRNVYYFLDYQVSSQSDLSKMIRVAQKEFIEKKFDAFFKIIIEANRLDKSFHHDLPRKTAISMFEILGKDDPMTKKYRRLFNMVLY